MEQILLMRISAVVALITILIVLPLAYWAIKKLIYAYENEKGIFSSK